MTTRAHSKSVRFANYGEVPETYAALCGHYLPRPLHSAADARAAAAVMESLAGFPLNRDQEDYLEIVAHFVDEFDRAEARAVPAAKGGAVLKHLLSEHQLTAVDLSRLLGSSRNLGAMILRGERNLTVAHIRKLAAHFHVSASVFL